MANQPKKYKKFVATAATATLVASAIVPVASAAGFKDVPANHEHVEAINALTEEGIINGYADGTFKPGQAITRGQVVKLLGRWLEAQGQEIPEDWATEERFSDLPVDSKDEELVQYAALAKDAGVFNGSKGNLLAANNITRQQMAVVLVRAIEEITGEDLVAAYKEAGFETEISDHDKAFSSEQTDAITALEYAEITIVPTGKFRPTESLNRGQFASFLYRTINLELDDVALSGSVKAINNTTVEVTFDEEVENLNDLNFAIEGLEIGNKAVKQTNKKVVVLTTSAQTADVDYTVTLNDEKIGSFKGLGAVIPTAVTVVEFQNPVVEKDATTQVNSHKSQQAPLGTQVVLKAQVTVAEGQSKAGIPVTFNIIDASNKQTAYASLNQPILAEATTDENGVATYTYTRYASTEQSLITNDEVQVYATGNPTLRDFSKVYWANTQPLTITEVTTGNKLNNGSKKVYKVKLAGINNAAELEQRTNGTINVGFLDNVNVAPDKANKNVTVTDNTTGITLGYPGQFTSTNSTETNRFNAVKVKLDAKGEGTFTLTGSNETVTPFVWHDVAVGNTNATVDRFDKTELVAFAAPITFAKEQVLNLKIESLGTKDASAYEESFDRSGNYEYRNGTLVLVRDPNGLLTGANPSAIPAGSTKINNNNPVRSNEVVPSGFVYTTLGSTAVSGVANLEGVGKFPARKTNQLSGHLSKYSYTGTVKEKNEALVADLTNTGGRDYKVSYTDKDGKAAQSGQVVKVSLKYGSAKTTATASTTPIYFIDNNSHTVYKVSDFSKDKEELSLVTDAKGQVSFTVIGGRDSYATPTTFVETGDKAGLDTNDAQEAGEIAYFGDRTINSAKLTIDNEDTVSKSVADEVTFTYQSTDQNKKHYHVAGAPDFIATFQVSTTYSPATVVYTDRNGVVRTETVAQGSRGSFDVKSTNGKADIKVVSVRGNRVDVVASAHSLPVLNASATFSTLNNEGIAYGQSVRGKVVAVDTTNNRILLTDAKGEKVYDLKYEADELYYKGTSGASEATFESYLTVGDELFFTQKADANGKAKFDNLDIYSGITVNETVRPNDRKAFIVEGDYTSTAKVYDFAKGAPVADVVAGKTTVNADFQINGDNVTLSNVKIVGNVTVGRTNATQAQILNDFALNNVEVTGTVTVNQGDGNTFNVNGSQLNKVVLNIKEHINLDTTSSINEVTVTTSGTYFTGAGRITAAILNNGATLGTAPAGQTQLNPGNTVTGTDLTNLFTVATTSGDTASVTLTFSANVATADVANVKVTDLATTPDTATIAQVGTTGRELKVSFANVTDITTKKFEVTYKGVVYVVVYDKTATTPAWSFTRK